MAASVKSAKAELRKAIQRSLSSLSSEEVARQCSLIMMPSNALRAKILIVAARIHDILFALPEYQSARSISVYLSMPASEVTTGSIVLSALEQGKIVYVPYLHKDTADGLPKTLMDMVTLRSKEDYQGLKPDGWGIPTITRSSIAERKRCLGEQDEDSTDADQAKSNVLDMIVMPGVAFDEKLQRLGHGKGFYDFFLAQYSKHLISKGRMPFLGRIDAPVSHPADRFQSVLHFNNSVSHAATMCL